jgi:hypothetical protein
MVQMCLHEALSEEQGSSENRVMLNCHMVETVKPLIHSAVTSLELYGCSNAPHMIRDKAHQAPIEDGSCPVNDTFLLREELVHL